VDMSDSAVIPTGYREQDARRWWLDRNRSVVELSVRAFWGLRRLSGRFEQFDGSYAVDAAGAKLSLTVDLTSFDPDGAALDDPGRTGIARAVANYPQVSFFSTQIVARGDGGLQVTGEVVVGDARYSVSFPATLRAVDGAIEIEVATAVDDFGHGMPNGQLGM